MDMDLNTASDTSLYLYNFLYLCILHFISMLTKF